MSSGDGLCDVCGEKFKAGDDAHFGHWPGCSEEACDCDFVYHAKCCPDCQVKREIPVLALPPRAILWNGDTARYEYVALKEDQIDWIAQAENWIDYYYYLTLRSPMDDSLGVFRPKINWKAAAKYFRKSYKVLERSEHDLIEQMTALGVKPDGETLRLRNERAENAEQVKDLLASCIHRAAHIYHERHPEERTMPSGDELFVWIFEQIAKLEPKPFLGVCQECGTPIYNQDDGMCFADGWLCGGVGQEGCSAKYRREEP